jgi:hypothetical protein
VTISREEALGRLRASGRSEEAAAPRWTCRVGPLLLTLPNFGWRRRALAAHDLHHLMTGYPMTMRGEFQMAAWELGAGRFAHWGATLMCAPLAAIGFFWSPRRILGAYRRGRAEKSLYCEIEGLER